MNQTIARVERERERESYNLKDKANLGSTIIIEVKNKLYIRYEELKINMLNIHRQTVF